MDPVVVLLGTLDTKGTEYGWLRDRLAAAGCRVLLVDVGVAGIHRTLARLDVLREAGAIVVVAGMDGALPSVVAGLVRVPVVAVPTSIGYGAAFGGIAPLLAMLNACAPGVAVVLEGELAEARAASFLDGRPRRAETGGQSEIKVSTFLKVDAR